jgi:hypothetical protein
MFSNVAALAPPFFDFTYPSICIPLSKIKKEPTSTTGDQPIERGESSFSPKPKKQKMSIS